MINRKLRLLLLLPLLIIVSAASCNKYHAAVVIEHDFKISIAAAQQIEINEFRAGNIPADTHKRIEEVFLKIAQGGEQVASLLLQNADKVPILTAITDIANSLQVLQTEGTLGIKNPTTQNNFKLAIQAAIGALDNLKTFVGGA